MLSQSFSGNIFIFSLSDKNYWQLPDTKVQKSTTIDFIPHQTYSDNLLIGNKLGFIYEIEISKYQWDFII